jgi:CSLREA domain-containing protein
MSSPFALGLFLAAFALSFSVRPPALLAAALAPDVVPLAAAAGGVPIALASADLDADGMPDLVVAYASAGTTTLVVHPGDVEAVYPTPGAPRALMAAPFGTPYVLATVEGAPAALTAVDVDADGLKDLVVERRLGDAVLFVGFGDGTVDAPEPVAADVVSTAKARAAAFAPRHLETAAPRAFDVVPDVFRMAAPDGTLAGYRASQAVKDALARPAKSVALAPPDDALAVLPMRLNRDAVSDLVVIRPGAPAPEALISRAAATFVVTTTKDENGACDASCSLREAIVAANATPDLDTIEFAIPTSDPGFQPGTGTWLIVPKGVEYPVITAPVTIDGRTQPGWAGAPLIELSGEGLSEDRVGLDLSASTSVIRGLIVSDWSAFRENGESFCGCGISLVGANNSIIEGNYVGTDATGLQAKPNGQNGIAIISGSNNLVGGTTAEARNVVSGNRDGFFFDVAVGTFISSGTTDNTFAGNYLGVDRTGYNALPNLHAVLLNSGNNTVGGTDPGSGNVIAGNAGDMVSIFEAGVSADGNKVLRNFVGIDAAGTKAFDEGFGYGVASTDADGTVVGSPGNGNVIAGNDYGVLIKFEAHRSTSGHLVQGNTIGLDALGRPLGNGGPGVRLDNVFDATIGGTGNGEANVIAHNSGPGVLVNFVATCSSCTTGTLRSNQNRILSNAIFDNTGRGIDLASAAFGDGVTANDGTDADTGANDLLNWPVLTSASSTASTATVDVQALTQGPASGQPYLLQFFASPSCDTVGGNGEGRIFLAGQSASANGNPVVANLAVPIPNGYVVTATATDSLGNTSELSNCVTASGGPAAVATATATPLPTATPVRTPQPGETPTVAPTNVVGAEICDNCRDDDGDTIVDRDDPDCGRPRANGFGGHAPTAARAKAITKCQALTAKQGATLVAKQQKLMRKCVQGVLACVQLKAGDAGCLTKAGVACKALPDALEKLEAKIEDKLAKGCGTPPVAEADIPSPFALGYGAEESTCESAPFFSFGPDDGREIGSCVEARHRCQAAQLISLESPRARELITLAGGNPGLISSCLLTPAATGGGQGVGDATRGKVLAKCAQGMQKAAAKFTQARLGGFQKCLAGVTKCVQQKPGDAGCLNGARAKCAGAAAKIGDGPKGAGTKARAAIAKACTGVDADVLAANGLNAGQLAGYCAAIGVAPLATAADVGECLLRHHTCRVGQLLDVEIPRTRELLDVGGVAP